MTASPRIWAPDQEGTGLPELVAELEWRMTGVSFGPRLRAKIAHRIPRAETYVLLLIDGLGARQLVHPAASSLAAASRGTLHAPFPTTTIVSLATIASGLPPGSHGIIGHFMLLRVPAEPVNVLRWVSSSGRNVRPDPARIIPQPNLWERLKSAGVEPITVQPRGYSSSPTSRILYRGCRFEGADGSDDFVQAVTGLASVPGRFVFAYLPDVDVAAHVEGFRGSSYRRALAMASNVWDGISAHLADGALMVGTADHGLVTVGTAGKYRIRRRDHPDLTFFGDPRSLYVRGPEDSIARLAARLPATWCTLDQLTEWWGSGDRRRGTAWSVLPHGAFLADRGRALLPGHFDRRMVGYHGGLDPAEVEIPLLVSTGSSR